MPNETPRAITRYFSDHCFVCGQQNTHGFQAVFLTDGEKAWADVTPPRRSQGFGGVVHGGLVTALLDETMWYALYVNDLVTMTVHLDVTLRRSLAPGAPVRVEGRFIEQDRRYYVAEAVITNRSEDRLAYAQGRFLRVPKIEAHLQGTIKEESIPSPAEK